MYEDIYSRQKIGTRKEKRRKNLKLHGMAHRFFIYLFTTKISNIKSEETIFLKMVLRLSKDPSFFSYAFLSLAILQLTIR